ncbi:hypothetical protein PMG71_14710 [Roseofilum sp. BLCC_M154]|uniref:Uncharacterized protein n=1 Tax=Roseofilum acuticapitatum BLCC-M154 TaxID=3022444 RepID=A0ABT7AUW5_9CYAN|nr:hypothetical protein [Roseofilum acuticapitatum]MDJ1170681.1 hypothetical protein [Roseofilum acuticapitatum BLCC-M154]
MAATDDFREAIKAGELLEALKTALSESIELEITTWISLPDPYNANPDDPPEAQPGYRMHSRINIVDGEIDTEVGSHFVGKGPFTELRDFHINQIRSSRQIIKRNLNSIQKLFGLWAEMQQTEFETVVTHLERVAAQRDESDSDPLESEAEVEWEIGVPPAEETGEEALEESVEGDRTPETSSPAPEEPEDDFFDSFDTQPTEKTPQPPSDPLDDIFGENESETSLQSQKQPDLSLETIAAAAGFTAAAIAVTSSAEASEAEPQPQDQLATDPKENNPLDIDSEEPLDDEEQEIMSAFDATYSAPDIIDSSPLPEPPLIPIEDSLEIPQLNTDFPTPTLESEDSVAASSFPSFETEEDEIMAAFDSESDKEELSTEPEEINESSSSLTDAELEHLPIVDVIKSDTETPAISDSSDRDFIDRLDSDDETSEPPVNSVPIEEATTESSEQPEANLPDLSSSDEDDIMAEFDAQYGSTATDPESVTESAHETSTDNSSDDSFLEELVTESTDEETSETEEMFSESSTEELLVSEEEPFAEEETSETEEMFAESSTEELLVSEEDPFAEEETSETEEMFAESSTEELLVSEEEDPFGTSEEEELWEEEGTLESSVFEESSEEELLVGEEDPFASSEEELLIGEEEPLTSSETEELWEEIEESESNPFAASEEDLSTEDLWEEEMETAQPELGESLGEDGGATEDPLASSEEELLMEESQESLWEKIEEAEGDPFGSAETELLDIPEASEEEEAEILSAFETDTMSETIWNDTTSSEEVFGETEELLDVFEEEEEVQTPLEVPDFSSDVTEELVEGEEEDVLDVFGDTEEFDFEAVDAQAEDRAVRDAKAVEEIEADMGDLWEDLPVSHTAPTVVEPDAEGMIDEFAQEGLDSFGESVQESILDESDGLDELLSEDWEQEEEDITPPAMTEELMLEEEDEVDPLADLFADEEDADPFGESLDLSEESNQEGSELLNDLGEDPFADLEDPFEEKKS